MHPRPDPAVAASRRRFLLALLAGGAGCGHAGVARVIMEGPEGSGIMGSKIFAILAEYQASGKQQEEAAAKAREIEQRLVAAARATPVPKLVTPQPAPPAAPSDPAPPAPAPVVITPAERKALPPVIAVKVTEERQQGAAAVMLWDTRTQSLAGNSVYDLKTEPPAGRKLTWKTSVASVQAVYAGDNWPN